MDKNATLTFDAASGGESLNAKFTNWYDVNVTRDRNDRITVALDDTGKTIDPTVKFQTAPTPGLPTGVTPGTPDQAVVFETEYYGDNNTPTEATSIFQYQQSGASGTINAVIGFGGKR